MNIGFGDAALRVSGSIAGRLNLPPAAADPTTYPSVALSDATREQFEQIATDFYTTQAPDAEPARPSLLARLRRGLGAVALRVRSPSRKAAADLETAAPPSELEHDPRYYQELLRTERGATDFGGFYRGKLESVVLFTHGTFVPSNPYAYLRQQAQATDTTAAVSVDTHAHSW